jgi:hypothetical protein
MKYYTGALIAIAVTCSSPAAAAEKAAPVQRGEACVTAKQTSPKTQPCKPVPSTGAPATPRLSEAEKAAAQAQKVATAAEFALAFSDF